MQIDIPGYRILRTLGKGGMASVYLAIQESFEREVALKIMSPELSKDSSFGDRFLREARIVSRLIHPNIVTVYDVGIHDGYYFLSMEYVPGQELTDKRYDLTLTDSLSVIKDIARALDFAGKKGYVHRDVKPENIMLHEEGGRAVLMDFGIARPSDVASGMTQTGMAIGTPHYMSPEQAKGMPVDTRADLYSLGVVLFLLLTGRVPYHADSAVVVGIMHVSEDIPRLPPYAQVFQSIIDRILAKDPADRYQTGAEFVRDLEAFAPKEIADAAENRELAMALVKAEEIAAAAESQTNLTAASGADESDTSFSSSENEKTILAGRYAEPEIPLPDFSAQRVDETPNDSTLEAMAAVAEDRVGRHEIDDEKQSSKLGLWLVLGIFVVAGCGFYFQAALRETLGEYLPGLQVSEMAQSSDGENQTSISSVAEPKVLAVAPPDDVAGIVYGDEQNTRPFFAEQAASLQASLASDLSKAADLAAHYRAGLESTDTLQQDMAKQGLLDLQTFYSTSIQQALDAGDVEQAQRYVESLQGVFAEAEYEVSLQEVLAKKRSDDALTVKLQQAQTYITENALSSPVGANALEIYQALLLEDPDLVIAKEGIVNIAQRYGELAAEQQQKGNVEQALGLIAQGLVVNADNVQLLEQQQLLTQLHTEQKKQRAAENVLLEKAKRQQAAGQLIAPRGDSAVETYRELLTKNAQHRVARNAVEAIEKSLLAEIKQLIQAEDFTAASARLASARESFPQSRTLLSLNLDLDQAINEHLPRVVTLAVTSHESDSLSAQEPTIAADRNIYIGFEYRNFKSETSVIQAILYEGSRSHQIVQVPVIVSGKQGVQFFRMEQPVTGFAEGGYSIDLLLNNQLLITAKFSVKKSL